MIENGKMLENQWKHTTVSQDRYNEVRIALVGKYTDLHDSYMSVSKALEHSAFRTQRKLVILWVESEDLESDIQQSSPARYHDAWKALVSADGVLVPGGFGHRGTEGMLLAINYARKKKIPFLGICLGFQLAVIEWARYKLKMKDATSEEFTPNVENPVIVFMPEISKTHMGGTMRLGLRPTVFEPGTEQSIARKLYAGEPTIWERHRHRYEVNPALVDELSVDGFKFVGKDERGERMQILEYENHPFFLGFQAHPEFCTRPLNPSPPLLGFVAAASGENNLQEQFEYQAKYYRPPHAKSSMISENAMKNASEAVAAVQDESQVHMNVVQVVNEDM